MPHILKKEKGREGNWDGAAQHFSLRRGKRKNPGKAWRQARKDQRGQRHRGAFCKEEKNAC